MCLNPFASVWEGSRVFDRGAYTGKEALRPSRLSTSTCKYQYCQIVFYNSYTYRQNRHFNSLYELILTSIGLRANIKALIKFLQVGASDLVPPINPPVPV